MLMTMQGQPGGQSDPTQPQDTVGSVLKRLWATVRRRHRMLLGIALLAALAAVAVSLVITPRYESTARVRIDPRQTGTSSMGDQATLPDQSLVDTEVGIMRSRDLAVSIVRQLNLVADPEFTKNLDHVADGAALSPAAVDQRVQDVATNVLKRLSVEREKSTYIVGVSFQSVNAQKAALIANAFAEGYIRLTATRRSGTAEQQAHWIAQQMAQKGSEAQSANAKLAQYRASEGITQGTTTSGTITDQQIAPLSSQLASAEAQASADQSDVAAARQQVAQGGVGSVSAVINSPLIAQLREQRATVVGQMSQMATRYGEKHPQTVQIKQQMTAIDNQIEQESHRIIGSLENKARASAAQAGSLRSDLNRLRGEQASNAKAAVVADSLQRDAEAKNDSYRRLADMQHENDQLSHNTLSQAQIVEAASPSEKANHPNRLLIVGAGVALGFMAGAAVITLQELLAGSIGRPSDLPRVLGIPFVASIPRMSHRQLKGAGKDASPANLVLTNPISAYAESLRNVRSSLLLNHEDTPRVIAIVSTLPDEGKTTTLLSLARVMAMSGDRVCVVDCDVRRVGLSRLVGGAEDEPGLIDVLRDRVDPLRLLKTDAAGVDYLTVSKPHFDPSDLFAGEGMPELLRTLTGRYDFVLLDTPPLLGVADARIVAAQADVVLVAIKWDSTPRDAIKAAIGSLVQDQSRIMGGILTMVDPSAEAIGALYYSRRYTNYYVSS